MVFVDASALIAIIAGEPEAAALADVLEAERLRLCSALSVWETVAGLCHSYTFSVPAAHTHVRRFLEVANMQFVSLGERECDCAVKASAEYGRPSPGGAHHGRLLRLRVRPGEPGEAAVQGRGFHPDRHRVRPIEG
jgi:uncharacterized protein with PIN domain